MRAETPESAAAPDVEAAVAARDAEGEGRRREARVAEGLRSEARAEAAEAARGAGRRGPAFLAAMQRDQQRGSIEATIRAKKHFSQRRPNAAGFMRRG